MLYWARFNKLHLRSQPFLKTWFKGLCVFPAGLVLGDVRRKSSACSVNWCTQSWESKVSWRGWFFLFCLGPVPSFLWAKTPARGLGWLEWNAPPKHRPRCSDVFERRTSNGSELFSLLTCLDVTKFVLSSIFILIVYLKVDKLHKSFFFSTRQYLLG